MTVWNKASDRPPTKDDGDKYGYVLVWSRKANCVLLTHWSTVPEGTLWGAIWEPHSWDIERLN
jgi:hypothetical protein